MKRLIIIGFLVSALVPDGVAAEFSQAATAIEARVERAVSELARVTEEIEIEKVPLIKDRNNLEAQVIQLRQQVAKLESLKNGKDALLTKAERELNSREDEVNYLTGLIADYSRNFETRIHIAEVQQFQSLINDAKEAVADGNLSDAEKLRKQLPLVDAAIARVSDLLGGHAFKGEVLGGDGKVVTGDLVVLGPLTLFSDGNASSAGTVELVLGSAEPTVVKTTPEHALAIEKIVSSGQGSLPMDPSGGLARKMDATKDTLVEQWRKGGPVMIPILGLGFLSVLVGLFKWFQIGRIKQASARDVQIILEHIKADRTSNAIDHAEQIGGPAGVMLKRAIENADEDKELLDEMLYEQMLDTRPRLERWMPIIALTAATAPLLGLLGTVTGMINTFNLISVFGTGDPRMLSSGISEALITTMYGLVVAIPALLLHAVISRKAKGLLGSMEQAAVAFVNGAPKPGTQI